GSISDKSTRWLYQTTTPAVPPDTLSPEAPQARSLLLHRFGFHLDRHLLAHDDAAGLERLVPAEAEVLPVDLGLGREADPEPAPGVGGAALEGQLERDGPGDALDREVALDGVAALAGVADRPALVGHGRPGLGVEEVAGAEVAVALLVAGVDAGRADRDRDRGFIGVLADLDGAGHVRETAPDLRDHQVADGEADLAVTGVERVGPGGGHFGAVNRADGGIGGRGGQAHGGSPPVRVILSTQSLLTQAMYSSTVARARIIPGIVEHEMSRPLEDERLTAVGLFFETAAGLEAALGRHLDSFRAAPRLARDPGAGGPLPPRSAADGRPRRPGGAFTQRAHPGGRQDRGGGAGHPGEL